MIPGLATLKPMPARSMRSEPTLDCRCTNNLLTKSTFRNLFRYYRKLIVLYLPIWIYYVIDRVDFIRPVHEVFCRYVRTQALEMASLSISMTIDIIISS
ncbi:hypothetical protein FRB95_006276 [Tulasnella sp. JGI-2019a]|nr:hypothetical protein FRB95_006276 [Tulasnella sp. JGI-2019a]